MSAIRNGKNPEDIFTGAIAREPGNNAFQETGQGGKSRIESVCLRSHDRILAGKQTDTVCRKFLRIKKNISLELFDEECGILLKDDAELKNYFQTHTITTINKLLKEEISENQD